MEVRIGVQFAPRELVIESTQTAEEIEQLLGAALAGKTSTLSLEDEKGRRVLVPSDKLAYLEIGESAVRRVGFGAI